MKMATKKTKGQHLLFIGSIIIIIGGAILLLCVIMVSKAQEQPWPRDAYVYTWMYIYPMFSIFVITFGIVILIEGLVETYIIKSRTVSIGFIILIIGPIVIYLFTEQINDLLGVSFHFGQFLVALGGFYLICCGATFLFSKLYHFLKEHDINKEHRKYICAKCGFKTQKLDFEPLNCPKCSAAFTQST